jgi:hypothetical protein
MTGAAIVYAITVPPAQESLAYTGGMRWNRKTGEGNAVVSGNGWRACRDAVEG